MLLLSAGGRCRWCGSPGCGCGHSICSWRLWSRYIYASAKHCRHPRGELFCKISQIPQLLWHTFLASFMPWISPTQRLWSIPSILCKMSSWRFVSNVHGVYNLWKTNWHCKTDGEAVMSSSHDCLCSHNVGVWLYFWGKKCGWHLNLAYTVRLKTRLYFEMCGGYIKFLWWPMLPRCWSMTTLYFWGENVEDILTNLHLKSEYKVVFWDAYWLRQVPLDDPSSHSVEYRWVLPPYLGYTSLVLTDGAGVYTNQHLVALPLTCSSGVENKWCIYCNSPPTYFNSPPTNSSKNVFG